MTKKYTELPLIGGLNFETGNSKPLDLSKSAPASNHSESDHQVIFFDLLKMNAPRPCLTYHRNKRGEIVTTEDLTDERYLAHEFYILTRVRHFPNGGYRHSSVAKQLKAEGVKAGAFDIFLDAARHGYHGLRLEMKINKNKLTAHQIEERNWLKAEGYCAHVVWHWVEALYLVAWYCGINPRRLRGYPSSPHAVALPGSGHDARCGCDLQINEKLFDRKLN